ncbi:MAG: hypothetical protein WC725_05020 [Patescibacteria group bacterium]|jgi:hypothetical protein
MLVTKENNLETTFAFYKNAKHPNDLCSFCKINDKHIGKRIFYIKGHWDSSTNKCNFDLYDSDLPDKKLLDNQNKEIEYGYSGTKEQIYKRNHTIFLKSMFEKYNINDVIVRVRNNFCCNCDWFNDEKSECQFDITAIKKNEKDFCKNWRCETDEPVVLSETELALQRLHK